MQRLPISNYLNSRAASLGLGLKAGSTFATAVATSPATLGTAPVATLDLSTAAPTSLAPVTSIGASSLALLVTSLAASLSPVTALAASLATFSVPN